MKTHWKKNIDTNYLGSWDLQAPNGSYVEREVLITRVVREMLHDPSNNKKSAKNIAHISGGSKPMILNSTNCKMMAKLFKSPNVEDWANKHVVIYVEKVKAFGELHDSLRIKGKAASQTAPSATSQQHQKPAEPPPIPCEDCGEYIQGFTHREDSYTAEQMAERSKAAHGKHLCLDCSGRTKARKELEQFKAEESHYGTNTW